MFPSKPLKGAILGFGFISEKGHLPAYLARAKEKKDVSIDAVADICPARLEIAKAKLPHARHYANPLELIEKEAEHLDFIDVSTPPYEHTRLTLEGLKAGLHVLCEKPLTTSTASALEMAEEARRSERVLFPCHNYKHAPVVRAIRDTIRSGEIGEVRSLTLQTFRNTHAKGVPEWNTHWRREQRYSGGGIAMDHGSHSFYLTFDWLGAYPLSVTAKMENQSNGKFDNEDFYNCVLTFPGGKTASCHLTWTAGVRKVMYGVQGSKGAITVQDDEIEIARIRETSGPDVAQGAVKWEFEKKSLSSDWMDASHVTWFDSMFSEFLKAIETRDFVGKDAKDALKCIQLIETSYRSARENSRELPIQLLNWPDGKI